MMEFNLIEEGYNDAQCDDASNDFRNSFEWFSIYII